MVTPEQIQQAISRVNDQTSFIQGLLYDTLQWPVDGGIEKVEDISFAWTAQELRAEGLDQKVVEGQIWQIQPLQEKQPWGVFLLEFNNVDAFIKGRGLTGPLRKVLRGLVSRRRKSNLPMWQRENLLFICTHDYKYFRFGYFKAPEETKTAPLITFCWGPDTPVRTACEFNLPALVWPESPDNVEAWQEQWQRAFDKEKLTKDFFKTFANLYHQVVDDIAEVRELKNEAGKLAQLLLDRMLFLYFIQKKGWLDQKSDNLYSRFLYCWEKEPDGHNYYSSVLYPLFLGLSNANFDTAEIGSVPFLNGGLFEETTKQSQSEQIVHARLRVQNSTFRLIFDNLLERFNFTVTEDTPLNVEVAIDPEMLGKIFESLILQLEKEPRKDLRKLTGSYYTPRPVVHFMCQEALKEYLVTQLAGDNNAKIQEYQQVVGVLLMLPQADEMDHEQIETLKSLFTPAEAKNIRQFILNCRICDPAVGSGAFPVGMLHEMVAAIARLDLCVHGQDILIRQNYYYDLKKQIIESCLYGVDIQEQAVRLCELRLWLSLVVDYQIDPNKPFAQAIREVPSLPNLSYRIIRGDSLLERLFGHLVSLNVMAKDAKTKQLIESIQVDKQAYFREGSNLEKRRMELKILGKQAELAERLIDAKRLSSGVQGDFWGEEAITTKARKEKAKQEARAAELQELKEKVAQTKAQLERRIRQKEMVDRGDLDTLRRQYFHTGEAPTFMWNMDFAEVFVEKGGFDIVIGNPPYLESRSPQFTADMKDAFKEAFEHRWPGYPALPRGSDLLVYFLELSISIVSELGHVVLITQNSWLDTEYGKKLQGFLLKSTEVRAIIDSDYKYFDSKSGPNINTVIVILKGKNASRAKKVRFIRCHETFERQPLSVATIEKSFKSDTVDCYVYSSGDKSLENMKWGILLAADTLILEVLAILQDKGKLYSEIADTDVKIGQGLNLSSEHFVSSELISEFSFLNKAAIPIMTNSDGAVFELNSTAQYLVDGSKLSSEHKKLLASKGVETFDPRSTSKDRPVLILPRGVSRHFCVLNSIAAFSSSYVDIYAGSGKRTEEIIWNLWLFLNSSILWLLREIGGRKNLGGGLLKAEAVDLKSFPIYLILGQTDRIKSIFSQLRKREALPTLEELETDEHRAIDQIVFDYLDLQKNQREAVLDSLAETIAARAAKSQT